MLNTKFYIQFQFQFLLIFSLIKFHYAFVYGPSLEFLTSLENSVPRRINLSDYGPYYSVLVPLAVNKSTAEPYLVRPVGEFSVEAPPQMRIMAVIQSLHLRTKSVTKAFPPVCRDFIRFGDESINKICGDVSKNERKGSPPGMMGARTFLSTTNYLNVTVFTDSSTFVETWSKKPNIVEISFTAYQSCPFYDPDEYMLNCLENIIPYGPSCISANLSCDGIINCGFLPDGTFSKDEMNCPVSFPDLVQTTSTMPPITSTTSSPLPKTGFPGRKGSWDWELKEGRDSKISNIPSIYIEDVKINIHPTFHSSKSSFNPFNYVGIFIVVIGVSIFIKIIKCVCQDYKNSTTTSTTTATMNLNGRSDLVHTISSVSINTSSSVPGSTIGQISSVNHHLPGRLYGGISGHHTAIPVHEYNDNDSPPPYHSLFPSA